MRPRAGQRQNFDSAPNAGVARWVRARRPTRERLTARGAERRARRWGGWRGAAPERRAPGRRVPPRRVRRRAAIRPEGDEARGFRRLVGPVRCAFARRPIAAEGGCRGATSVRRRRAPRRPRTALVAEGPSAGDGPPEPPGWAPQGAPGGGTWGQRPETRTPAPRNARKAVAYRTPGRLHRPSGRTGVWTPGARRRKLVSAHPKRRGEAGTVGQQPARRTTRGRRRTARGGRRAERPADGCPPHGGWRRDRRPAARRVAEALDVM